MIWIVEFDSASPDGGDVDHTAFKNATRLLGSFASGTINIDGWKIQFAVEARDIAEAYSIAAAKLSAASQESDLPEWPLIAGTVLDAEYSARYIVNVSKVVLRSLPSRTHR